MRSGGRWNRVTALVVFTLASLAVHAALLVVALSALLRPHVGAVSALSRPQITARVTVLPVRAAVHWPHPDPIPPGRAVAMAMKRTIAAATVAGTEATASGALLNGPAPAAIARQEASTTMPSTSVTERGDDIAPPPPSAHGDFDGYVPREWLTVAPVIRSTVLLDGAEQPDGHYQERLTLYIDETGTVRRVEPDSDALPPVLLDQARAAFLGAQFEPGQVDGHIVRSRIQVSVEFENHVAAVSSRQR